MVFECSIRARSLVPKTALNNRVARGGQLLEPQTCEEIKDTLRYVW